MVRLDLREKLRIELKPLAPQRSAKQGLATPTCPEIPAWNLGAGFNL